MTVIIALMHWTLQQNATLMAHMQTQPSPPLVQQTLTAPTYKPQRPPFPKWDGTPQTTHLFLAQFSTYKSKAFYSGVHNWTQTTQASKHLSVAISANILASIPREVSLMFLNDTRFASDRIAMLSRLLTRLNLSSSENLLLAISDLTRLGMGLGESTIDYMSLIRGISQRMQGITMEKIVPLLAIASLDHNRYPGVNI